MKSALVFGCIALLCVILGAVIANATRTTDGVNQRVCISAVGPVDINGQGNSQGNLKCEDRP